MYNKSKHSPTPWKYEAGHSYGYIEGPEQNDESAGFGKADAAFIVRAANSHDILVKSISEASKLQDAVRAIVNNKDWSKRHRNKLLVALVEANVEFSEIRAAALASIGG